MKNYYEEFLLKAVVIAMAINFSFNHTNHLGVLLQIFRIRTYKIEGINCCD
jgi:hypothetical protein